MARYFIITGVYLYFQETLRLRDRLGKTRLEFKENPKSIKGVAPALVEISVQKTYRVSQRELAPAKAKVPRTKMKFVPKRTIDSKQREHPVETITSSQIVAVSTSALAQKEESGGPMKCYRCGKLSHFARDCKSKDAVAAMVLDNSGKSGS